MSELDKVRAYILSELLTEFREHNRKTEELTIGYEGISFELLRHACGEDSVSFDVTFEERIKQELIGTGPYTPHKNEPGSGFFFFGGYYAREYVHLKENGYKAALKIGRNINAFPKPIRAE
ncbi:MAG TPA: hypothetical protein VEM35_01065, partial [Rhizomicrobium sp.]|nr:hypothetical protein [Rhizomicrobium sp.]